MSSAIDEREYLVGDVLAFKQFRIVCEKSGWLKKRYGEPRLVSANPRLLQEYGTGVNHAQCPHRNAEEMRHPESPLPDEECSCGFYALKDCRDWITERFSGELVVDAVIRLSGKVIVGEKGYRAEKLEIVAMAPRFQDELTMSLLQELQEREFQDVPLFSSSSVMAGEFMLESGQRYQKKRWRKIAVCTLSMVLSLFLMLALPSYVSNLEDLSSVGIVERGVISALMPLSYIAFVFSGIHLVLSLTGGLCMKVSEITPQHRFPKSCEL